MLEIGFSAYILVAFLMDRSAEFAAQVVPSVEERAASEEAARVAAAQRSTLSRMRGQKAGRGRTICYTEAFDFFAGHCGRVEVVRNGSLERLYFPLPPMFMHLPKETRVQSRLAWVFGGVGQGLTVARRCPVVLTRKW